MSILCMYMGALGYSQVCDTEVGVVWVGRGHRPVPECTDDLGTRDRKAVARRNGAVHVTGLGCGLVRVVGGR